MNCKTFTATARMIALFFALFSTTVQVARAADDQPDVTEDSVWFRVIVESSPAENSRPYHGEPSVAGNRLDFLTADFSDFLAREDSSDPTNGALHGTAIAQPGSFIEEISSQESRLSTLFKPQDNNGDPFAVTGLFEIGFLEVDSYPINQLSLLDLSTSYTPSQEGFQYSADNDSSGFDNGPGLLFCSEWEDSLDTNPTSEHAGTFLRVVFIADRGAR